MDRIGRPALCVETGGWGEGSGPQRSPWGPSPFSPSSSAAQMALQRLCVVRETSGGDPARRPRGLGFEAEGGMAGRGGSGWEEAVGEGRGRAVTSGRASRRAAATLTLIRCRVTKWRIGPQWPPPSSAARKESAGLEGSGRRRPGRKCHKWLRIMRPTAFAEVNAGAFLVLVDL